MAPFFLALQVLAGVEAGSRIDRLWDWLTLVEEHAPGSIDDPALTVATWSPEELERILRDLPWLFTLVRDPGAPLPLAAIDPQRSSRARVRGFSASDAAALRALARAIERQERDVNAILKRGAMLHTDIAVLSPQLATAARAPDDNRLGQTTLPVEDGRQQGLRNAVGHWAIARRLLDEVTTAARRNRPSPENDPMVQLWYRATLTVMLLTESLHVQHVQRAVTIFPRDPAILLLAGSHHEALGSPRVQATLRSARIPRGVSFGVGSQRDEWAAAERLFRRALEADPARVEARIRLGRVMILRGRPREAIEQLRQAVPATTDRLLSYYAHLFLAAAATAAGDPAQARLAYERAAALFPSAQSPRLGLSDVAAEYGDAAAARAALSSVLEIPPGSESRADPWWSYYISAGRDAAALLSDLAATVDTMDAR